ncbi:MAG TPA: alanine--glyoxylate aminotransferase family protein [Candidatus Acidoferrum sp.]|nr:alanine--glyoxylate aminotransferase family protein [Candidatus Acidoferrum sp.]
MMNPKVGDLTPPNRLMLTPGPSSVDPRIYRALSTPLVGHMDPWFNEVLIHDIEILMKYVFQTTNRITFPISASGSGGIEASMLNPLEAGDDALICVNGWFSERMAVVAERTPANIIRVEAPMGRTVDPDDVRRAGKGKKVKVVGLAHGETSTGVVQNIDEYRKVADELGALLVVDAVATLAGIPLDIDRQRIDICFSGSQKALSAPPGMSPITVSARAEEVIKARKTKVQSWYFDLTNTMSMWGSERLYHHTPPISLLYALREAMRMVSEETLEARWERHRQNQAALIAGLEAMGLVMLVGNPADRLATVTAVLVPDGVDELKTRKQLLSEFGIEIAGGFGALKGKMWRVGLMGFVSQRTNVLLFLASLEKVLLDQGYRTSPGAGVGAAVRSYTGGSTAARPATSAPKPVPVGAQK